jgi:hypothetical protein
LLAVAGVLSLVVVPSAGAALYGDYHDYARGTVGPSTGWNAAKADIPIYSGTIGADYQSGGHINETLWVSSSPALGLWVEVGYSRGWDPDANPNTPNGENILTAYWATKNIYSYYQHQVTSTTVSAGQTRTFMIKSLGSNNWGCYIDGAPAQDSGGDYTANDSWGNTMDHFSVGLESDCTTAHMGSSTDWIVPRSIQKSSTDGSTWSFGPADSSFQPPDGFLLLGHTGVTYHPFGEWGLNPPNHGGGGTPGQNLWNYENQNAP